MRSLVVRATASTEIEREWRSRDKGEVTIHVWDPELKRYQMVKQSGDSDVTVEWLENKMKQVASQKGYNVSIIEPENWIGMSTYYPVNGYQVAKVSIQGTGITCSTLFHEGSRLVKVGREIRLRLIIRTKMYFGHITVIHGCVRTMITGQERQAEMGQHMTQRVNVGQSNIQSRIDYT